jgi:hypothetical protein
MHRHHILPKRLGGDDSEENLTPPISHQLHAAFHKDLWEHYGDKRDYIAWKCLAGRMTHEEARLAAAKLGQGMSDRYMRSRKEAGRHLQSVVTKESCAKGGRAASAALVQWQKDNPSLFRQMLSRNGKATGPKLEIAHEYLGKTYKSKKALQMDTGLSNTGFYGKLHRGEIRRLGRTIDINRLLGDA